MNGPVGFAIVGSGSIAIKHAQALAAIPEARLVAICGRNAEQGAKFAAEYGAEFMGDIEALAAREDIQAATIATPSGLHARSALPFLRKGKAVLCEKPLETTLEKVDEILRAADANGAVLAGVFQLRLGAGAVAMKKAFEEGRFGHLALASAYLKWWRDQAYYDTAGWRGTWELDGGGALMNQGIHGVDLLQWLVGMPSEVFAFTGCPAHERIEVEDTAAIALKYPGGAMGVIEASTACKPGFATRIELCGSRGSAILEDDRMVCWQFDDDRPEDESIRAIRGGIVGGGSSDPKAISFEGHRILIADLVSALRDNRPPMISGLEARNAVRLIRAAYDSAAGGRAIKL